MSSVNLEHDLRSSRPQFYDTVIFSLAIRVTYAIISIKLQNLIKLWYGKYLRRRIY